MPANHIDAYAIAKGYEPGEARAVCRVAPKRTFPCTIGLRTFQTEEEYAEALADFMNSN